MIPYVSQKPTTVRRHPRRCSCLVREVVRSIPIPVGPPATPGWNGESVAGTPYLGAGGSPLSRTARSGSLHRVRKSGGKLTPGQRSSLTHTSWLLAVTAQGRPTDGSLLLRIYAAPMGAFLQAVLASLVAAVVLYFSGRILFTTRGKNSSDLVGKWRESSSTLDDDGVTISEHEEELHFRRIRFTRYFVARGKRIVPAARHPMKWSYLGRRHETVAFAIFWRTDTRHPLRCGTIMVRRQDDNTWKGSFVRPSESPNARLAEGVVIQSGLMFNPLTWSKPA